MVEVLPSISGLPSIVRSATEATCHTIAMQPIGRELRCLLREHVVSIVVAMKAVHEKGFVHRDIKPANLLYVPSNRETGYGLQGLIIDWGCAGSSGPARGRLGTIEYAACSILRELSSSCPYECTPQTDLESLLMSFLVIMFKTIRHGLAAAQAAIDPGQRAANLHTFWSGVFEGSKRAGPNAWGLVANAHQATMQSPPNYDEFASCVSALLPPTPLESAFPSTIQNEECL